MTTEMALSEKNKKAQSLSQILGDLLSVLSPQQCTALHCGVGAALPLIEAEVAKIVTITQNMPPPNNKPFKNLPSGKQKESFTHTCRLRNSLFPEAVN